MNKEKKVLAHNCIICQDNNYIFQYVPNSHPDSNAQIIESMTCETCGYPISAIQLFESESGYKYDEYIKSRRSEH